MMTLPFGSADVLLLSGCPEKLHLFLLFLCVDFYTEIGMSSDLKFNQGNQLQLKCLWSAPTSIIILAQNGVLWSVTIHGIGLGHLGVIWSGYIWPANHWALHLRFNKLCPWGTKFQDRPCRYQWPEGDSWPNKIGPTKVDVRWKVSDSYLRKILHTQKKTTEQAKYIMVANVNIGRWIRIDKINNKIQNQFPNTGYRRCENKRNIIYIQ